MKPRDEALGRELLARLARYEQREGRLNGIQSPNRRSALLEQFLESIHRIRYVEVIATRSISQSRADPDSDLFDPLKAAILHHRAQADDEAFWLVFLSVHFGKHRKGGWRYAKEVYGWLRTGQRWDWRSVSSDPKAFRDWLDNAQSTIERPGAGFGNHRKYQSLDANSPDGTGATVESYVRWVGPPRTHRDLIEDALTLANGDESAAFDYVYRSMNAVVGFGRMARFDYVTMIGKLGLAPVAPGSPYLEGSSGPLTGARLLFGSRGRGAKNARELDSRVKGLGTSLGLGMQVMEDALCNWQKHPDKFVPFRL